LATAGARACDASCPCARRACRRRPSLVLDGGRRPPPLRLVAADRPLALGTVIGQARLQAIEKSRTIFHHGE
jgi:hypothetical protein